MARQAGKCGKIEAMQRMRYIVLALVGVAVLGSLAMTGGSAYYLRSESYRRFCEENLSRALELPADIGRVVPRSFTAREYQSVVVWLPDRRDRALSCERAVVSNTPTDADPDAYEIDLRGGWAEISTRTWLREDYRTLIQSGLRTGFSAGGLQKVTFGGMNLTFVRERFRATLRGASGVLWFEGAQRGRVNIACHEFNGESLIRPVFLQAEFSPYAGGVNVDRVELKVPRLPLAIVGLDELIGAEVRAGSFEGSLTYEETGAGGSTLTVAGRCFELDLSEWTRSFAARPWRGRASEIALHELRVENRRPARLRFGGVLREVRLGDLLASAGLEGVSGTIALRVRDADISENGIVRFVASGDCTDLSLESLTTAIGWGRMSGNLRLVIDDLTIVDNRLASLSAEIRVDDALDSPNWIEGALLRELLARMFKVHLPPILPERIEYTRLGIKLDVRDEVLHLFGTHGPRQETIVTLRIFEQDWPIGEPQGRIDLAPWLDQLRAQFAEEVQRRLESRGFIGPPQPAPGDAGEQAPRRAKPGPG